MKHHLSVGKCGTGREGYEAKSLANTSLRRNPLLRHCWTIQAFGVIWKCITIPQDKLHTFPDGIDTATLQKMWPSARILGVQFKSLRVRVDTGSNRTAGFGRRGHSKCEPSALKSTITVPTTDKTQWSYKITHQGKWNVINHRHHMLWHFTILLMLVCYCELFFLM